MKKMIALFTICLLTIDCTAELNEYKEPKISSELLIEDLNTLQTWIYEAHGDPYRFSSKEEIDTAFDLARKVVQSKEYLMLSEFYLEVMKIMALLKDGHSQIFMPGIDRIEGQIFPPFIVRFIDYQPYVLYDLSGKGIPVNSRIIEINGYPTDELFEELSSVVHSDGNNKLDRYRKMESNFYLTKLLKVFEYAGESYSIKLMSDDAVTEMRVDALTQSESTRAQRLLRRNNSEGVLSLSFLEDIPNTAYLRISSFNTTYFDDNYKKFTDEIDLTFNEISSNNTESLILDLRNNRGGEDSYDLYVLRYLMNKNFRMYGELTFRKDNYKFLPDGKHWDIPSSAFKKNNKGTYDATDVLWPKGQSTLGEFEPFKNRYKGDLIVLINAKTFSAASELAAKLHNSERAVFIGEETGGSYIGSVAGFTPTLRLPNSKLMANLSLMNIRQPFFDSSWTDRGILPDIEIYPSIEDIRSGKDAILNRAKQYVTETTKN